MRTKSQSKRDHSAAESHLTTDHDKIRAWVEERNGRPAAVKATESEDDPGILRIDFPGYSGEGTLEPISWEEFFKKFEEEGLAFLFQERTADGKKSNFNKIVSRENTRKKKR